MNGTNRLEDHDAIRTKAMMDGVKGYIQKEIDGLVERMNKNRAQITAVGPVTNVEFPAEHLAKVLATELHKALKDLSWPQQTASPITNEVMPTPIEITTDNTAIAKALEDLGRMVSEAPLWDLVKGVNETNARIAKGLEANTKIMGELVKALNRPKEVTAFQQRILDELNKE